MDPKKVAALKALELASDGMTIGLGTGSTSIHFIDGLGEKARQLGWKIRGVPTSERSRAQAHGLGIPLVDLSDVRELDLAIDGADEADRNLSLIKGGGGALLREKLVAASARQFVVICDSSKLKERLGAFPLPVAIVPFGWAGTAVRLERFGVECRLREITDRPGQTYVTDDGLYIVDMRFEAIENPCELEIELKTTTGVVDVGLFVGLASRLILGFENGNTEVIEQVK